MLGVASVWDDWKGLNDSIQLAAIYTPAGIFVNPTYEDNYPTVNLKAQACGTSVLTYDTGSCKEASNN